VRTQTHIVSAFWLQPLQCSLLAAVAQQCNPAAAAAGGGGGGGGAAASFSCGMHATDGNHAVAELVNVTMVIQGWPSDVSKSMHRTRPAILLFLLLPYLQPPAAANPQHFIHQHCWPYRINGPALHMPCICHSHASRHEHACQCRNSLNNLGSAKQHDEWLSLHHNSFNCHK
jgi:hypothetical protein